MRNRRLCGWMVVLAMVLSAATVRAQAPEVLSQAPAGAMMVVAVPRLAALNQKLASFGRALGLNQPQLQNGLGWFQQQLGIRKGLNANGGAALVVMNFQPAPGGQAPVLALLPVSDYQDFLSNYGSPRAGADGISSITLPTQEHQTSFVKQAGGYAVLGPQRQLVAAYAPPAQGANRAGQAGELGQQVLKGADVLVYMDLQAMAPQVLPLIQGMVAQLQNRPPAPGRNGMQKELEATFAKLYGDVVTAILKDGQAAVLGIDLNDQGVGLSLSSQFKSGSQLAKAFAAAPAGQLDFNRLPDQPYLFVSASNFSTVPVAQWMQALTRQLPAGHPMSAMLKQLLSTYSLMSGGETQQAIYAPAAAGANGPNAMPMGMGGGLTKSVTVYTTRQPQQLVAAYRKALESLNQGAMPPGAPGQAGPPAAAVPAVQTHYQPNAMNIDGHAVDQYNMQFLLPPGAMQRLGPLALLLGRGSGGYVATAPDAVIVTSGLSPDLVKAAFQTVGGTGKLGQNPGIAQVRKQLGDHHIYESYFNVGSLYQMIGSFMALMGAQANIQVPADLPPVGDTLSVHNGGLLMRTYVPLRVITVTKDLAVQLEQMSNRQGGPQPGGQVF